MKTKTNYTKAKIIDMYGFSTGLPKKNELVFQIGGEGGEITISRQKTKSGVKYMYHHGEFDPTNEGLDVNINGEYNTFEQPFQLINNQFPWWYTLYVETVHEDVRNYIIDRFIEKLNEKSIAPEYFLNERYRMEEILNIKLNHTGSKQTNDLNWSFFTYECNNKTDLYQNKDSASKDKK